VAKGKGGGGIGGSVRRSGGLRRRSRFFGGDIIPLLTSTKKYFVRLKLRNGGGGEGKCSMKKRGVNRGMYARKKTLTADLRGALTEGLVDTSHAHLFTKWGK